MDSFQQWIKGIIIGDVNVMANVLGEPPMHLILQQCLMLEAEVDPQAARIARVLLGLLVSFLISIVCNNYIYPAYSRLLRFALNDYEGMFESSEYRFRCCPLTMDSRTRRQMCSGFGHPVGYEKWTFDGLTHMIIGLLYAKGVMSKNTVYSHLAIVLNSGLSDFSDICPALGITDRTNKHQLFTCLSWNRVPKLTCLFPLMLIMMHHVSSIVGMMGVLYSNTLKLDVISWGYFLIMFPGTTFGSFIFGVRQYKDNNTMRVLAVLALIMIHFVRFDGLYLFSKSVLYHPECQVLNQYKFLHSSLTGLVIFAFVFMGNCLAMTIPTIHWSGSPLPPNEAFPLALKKQKELCSRNGNMPPSKQMFSKPCPVVAPRLQGTRIPSMFNYFNYFIQYLFLRTQRGAIKVGSQ